jgi:intracellular multiplication protein IcmJ
MRLAPLVLSVRESGRTRSGVAQGSCPFCGVRFAEGQEPFPCPDGSADISCAPCHLVRHLERDTIAEEAVLIWLPEMTQAALNALAHSARRRLARDGALYGAASRFALTPEQVPNGVIEAIRALEARSFEAETRLGASSPRVLGVALMRMKPRLYEDRARLLGGLRLWPRGRFYVDGEDIYPQLIADRAAP